MAIVVVDYHKGNLSSVARGISRAGGQAVVTDDPEAIAAADAVVLPGVGAFADAMEFMEDSGQAEAVGEAIANGKPFLGICLGLQLLFGRGNEGTKGDGWTRGLDVFEGSCTRLHSERLKVPHVGWDSIDVTPLGKQCPLLAGVPEGANMYFTHSYALDDDVDPAFVAARTHYARSFASVVWGGTVFGTQFHPEKSSGSGLVVLKNFVNAVADPDAILATWEEAAS